MNREIKVTIAPSGEVIIEAVGYKGGACEQATAALEKALGLVKARKKKPEYFSAADTVTRQHLGR